MYYKDLNSNTCNLDCPNGQFIDSLTPNLCVACNFRCLRCATTSTNCFECAPSYYLYEFNNTCMSLCPPNFFNNPINTTNHFYCTKCIDGCETCTGPALTNCQTCQNVTVNGVVVQNYFKVPNLQTCSTSCPTGSYGNVLNNNCDYCQKGCVNCTNDPSNCFACNSAGGSDYFKTNDSNSCVTVCPDGFFSNSSDYTCR